MSKQPEFVLSKSYLLRAVETILQPQDKLIGRESKIKENFHNVRDAWGVNYFCIDRSHLAVKCNRQLKKKIKNSLTSVLNQMQLCLLAHDWDGYKELLLILFRSPNVANDYILFSIRSCFILLFNHPNRSPELLDNFMTACLRINEESRRIQYLEKCFTLKENFASALKKNFLNNENAVNEEEEEEIIFNSSFSSD